MSDVVTIVSRRYQSRGVYVGRPSRWSNPFAISPTMKPDDVLAQYRAWILAPEQAELRAAAEAELYGHVLACWCAPREGIAADATPVICHAQILALVASGAITP